MLWEYPGAVMALAMGQHPRSGEIVMTTLSTAKQDPTMIFDFPVQRGDLGY